MAWSQGYQRRERESGEWHGSLVAMLDRGPRHGVDEVEETRSVTCLWGRRNP
jgi:hypothetical protein